MPTPTYDLIASNVLGSSAASVTFSSIPATYRDLVLVFSGTNATGAQSVRYRFNSDTGTTYNWVRMNGDGSATSSFSVADTTSFISQQSNTTVTNHIIQVMDYSATDKHKSVLLRGNDASARTQAVAGRWASTSAVTSITVDGSNSYNFDAGSSFHLYGIVA